MSVKDNTNVVNLIVCGGSGQWAEENHYPSILELRRSGVNVRVAAICDPTSPYNPGKNEERALLNKLLQSDKPRWIDPANKANDDVLRELDELLTVYPNCALVVSTNPVNHYFYCKWALHNKVPIICDKPLVTTQNSAFNLEQAKLIQKQFDELKGLYDKNKQEDPHYVFCSPLRRRALTPFLEVAAHIEDVYQKTQQGIRYMNVVLNGGIHKYPMEYTKGGAHGHLGGVGTLSHSSYHYIDVIAWYILLARGETAKIDVSLTYILRVGEYLHTEGYKKLRELIEGDEQDFNDRVVVPSEVLNSELNFSFNLRLLDKLDNTVGDIQYIVNYPTFAPRTGVYDPEVTEYANDKNGGRMSSIYFDIHQGALQQWQIIKNDEVAKGHNLELRHYLHPLLGTAQQNKLYEDTYENNTLTSKSLFGYFVKSCLKQSVPASQMALLSTIDTQGLTARLYSMMYEKIAEDFYRKQHPDAPQSSSVIYLHEY